MKAARCVWLHGIIQGASTSTIPAHDKHDVNTSKTKLGKHIEFTSAVTKLLVILG